MRRNPAALRRWHGYEVGEGLQLPHSRGRLPRLYGAPACVARIVRKMDQNPSDFLHCNL